VVTVGAQAFYNCTAVESLKLPASLTEIGDWAFNPIVRNLPDEAITVVEGSVAAEYIEQFR
ncbi:MAG: leucine-rich repeat protein, partial [Clostridia bacterium]|nr:leucine-rich repeat protein [Clostridia bacterium]